MENDKSKEKETTLQNLKTFYGKIDNDLFDFKELERVNELPKKYFYEYILKK